MNIKPSEIVFLDYINTVNRLDNFPSYWKYEYGINVNTVPKKLMDFGLLTCKIDIDYNLSRLKVSELKEFLESNKLNSKGRKDELISRIKQNVDEKDLKNAFNAEKPSATEEGLKLIKEKYVHILNKQFRYGFSEFEIENAYNNLPKYLKPRDIVWHLLNDKLNEYHHSKDWGMYRNILYKMGNLLYKEDNYLNSLKYYVAIFIIDLSGLNNGNYVSDIQDVELVPGILTDMKNLVSLGDISSTKIENLFLNSRLTSDLPFKYYSDDISFYVFQDCCLKGIPFIYSNYPYSVPSNDNSNYDYYSRFDENWSNNSTKDTKKQPISPLKVGLGLYTCGLSLLFTGVRKKKKKK